MPNTQFQAVDANGKPLSGGLVYTYAAGTTTPLPSYTDSTGSTQNPNPVVLDTAGRASIWLAQAAYKIVVEDSTGTVQWSQDNVTGGNYVTNIPNLTTGVAYALSYCNNAAAPDESCINNAFSNGGVNTVQVAKGIAINGPVTVASGKVLILQPGTYALGNAGQFILSGNNSKLWCPGGPDQTVITVPQTYTATGGVVELSGNDPTPYAVGSSIEGCQIQFSQPDTGTRTDMIHYPPAILGAPHAHILHNKIVMAWDGIDMSQSVALSGAGSIIDDLRISAFDVAIKLDNTADSVHISNLHVWPYGVDATQTPAYDDPSNFGITSGRCDDLKIVNALLYVGTGLKLFTGTGPLAGPTFGEITATGFDNFNGISISAGNMAISSSYFTMGGPLYTGIASSGGELDLAGITFGGTSSYYFISTNGAGIIHVASSTFNAEAAAPDLGHPVIFVSGGNASVRVINSDFESGSVDAIMMLADNSGEMASIGNTFNRTTNIAYTQPTIQFGSTGFMRGTIADNIVSSAGSGSGVFVNITANNWIDVHDNLMLGHTISLPATHTEITSHDNN